MYEALIKNLRERSQWNPITEAKLMIEAAYAIEELQSQLPKWIPVTERLPEENKLVVATYWHENKRYSLIMLLDEFTWFRPTHWFYLPEPPKEETDG